MSEVVKKTNTLLEVVSEINKQLSELTLNEHAGAIEILNTLGKYRNVLEHTAMQEAEARARTNKAFDISGAQRPSGLVV